MRDSERESERQRERARDRERERTRESERERERKREGESQRQRGGGVSLMSDLVIARPEVLFQSSSSLLLSSLELRDTKVYEP